MGGYHAGGAACRVRLSAEIFPAEILPADGEECGAGPVIFLSLGVLEPPSHPVWRFHCQITNAFDGDQDVE